MGCAVPTGERCLGAGHCWQESGTAVLMEPGQLCLHLHMAPPKFHSGRQATSIHTCLALQCSRVSGPPFTAQPFLQLSFQGRHRSWCLWSMHCNALGILRYFISFWKAEGGRGGGEERGRY